MILAQLKSDSQQRRMYMSLAKEFTDGELFRAFLRSVSAQTRHAVAPRVETLPELLRNYTETDILRWRGIGKVGARELIRALAEIECQLGVRLKDSELRLRYAYIMAQFTELSMDRAQKCWT